MGRRRTGTVIAAAAAVSIVGVAGAAVAVGTSGAAAAPAAAPPPATGGTAALTAALGVDPATASRTQATGSTAQAADGTRAWKALHRVLHGQLVVTDGTRGATETVDVQRGTVTTVSAASVTIRSADGYVRTYVINDQTKVRTGHGTDSRVADIKTGDKAAVVAVQDGGAHVAKRLLTRPPG